MASDPDVDNLLLSDPPSSPQTGTSTVVMFIAASIAIITAIVSMIKTYDTSGNKASYEAISSAVRQVSKDNVQTKQELDDIRNYLNEERSARLEAAKSATAAALQQPPPPVQQWQPRRPSPQPPPSIYVPSPVPDSKGRIEEVKIPPFDNVKPN